MPPNGQGITALLALNILEGLDLTTLAHNSTQHLHLLIESLRLAFADTRHYVADPLFTPVPVQGMLSKEYAAERRAIVNPLYAALNIVTFYFLIKTLFSLL
jgi:gamma-glutamyltranspeptidase/glutathione hydrolase